MYPRRSSYLDADRLSTVAMLFLENYSGTYRTRRGLRTKIEKYLDNEYEDDLKWFDRDKNMELLVELVAGAGGIVIVELPPLPGPGGGRIKAIEDKSEHEGK